MPMHLITLYITDGLTDRQTYRQTDTQTDRQTDTHTRTHTHTHTHTPTLTHPHTHPPTHTRTHTKIFGSFVDNACILVRGMVPSCLSREGEWADVSAMPINEPLHSTSVFIMLCVFILHIFPIIEWGMVS